VCDVRFSHSPGRLDPAYLGNLGAFDVPFVVDLGDGTHGILGVVTRFHEKVERRLPKPSRMPRYVEVTDRSGAFAPGAIDAVNGTGLLEMWLDHLLVQSMLQHASGAWQWGRLVHLCPAGNLDFVDATARYRDRLVDGSTFASATIEDLLDAEALPSGTVASFRRRYVVD
jgi:PD-(D/E)XK nuclease superfamily